MKYLQTKKKKEFGFKASNLSVLAYANNFTIWHYVSDDQHSTVVSEKYFDKAVDMMRVGDMLILNADDANDVLWVTGNDGKSVTVSN